MAFTRVNKALGGSFGSNISKLPLGTPIGPSQPPPTNPRPTAANTGIRVPETDPTFWKISSTTITSSWLNANNGKTSNGHKNVYFDSASNRWILSRINVDGSIKPHANDFTMVDCFIDAGSGNKTGSSPNCIRGNTAQSWGGQRFEYCEMRDSGSQAIYYLGGGCEFFKSHIHHVGGDGINGNKCKFTACLIEIISIDQESPNPHADMQQSVGGGAFEFWYCSMNNPVPAVLPSKSCNAIIFMGAENGNIVGPHVIHGCWINGGNRTLQYGQTGGWNISGCRLTHNHFGPDIRFENPGLLDLNGVPKAQVFNHGIYGNRWDTIAVASGRKAYRSNGTPAEGKLIKPNDKVDDWASGGFLINAGFVQDPIP